MTLNYKAFSDLIPPDKSREIQYQAQTSYHHNHPPIKRLRDTILGVDVQWPCRPGPRLAHDARTALMAMINDPDPETRVQGLLGLIQAEVPEIMSVLIHALDDPAPQVRATALRELATRDVSRLTHELLNRLRSNDEATRVAAEQAFPRLKEHIEIPILEMLQSPDTEADARPALARALGAMNSRIAVDALSAAARDNDRALTRAATRALAHIAAPEALPALQEMSRHSSAAVRANALSGLARIGGPTALSAIEAMALNPRESRPETRRRAVHYIGLMGGENSLETLINAINRYPETRDTAAAALIRITGLNFGNSPRAWTRWYVERKKAQEKAPRKGSSQRLRDISPTEEKESEPIKANAPQKTETPPQ
ncbi:MAG: HEAT repeat domain-containing protein [Candidatus Hydrogenedentota bacterium]